MYIWRGLLIFRNFTVSSLYFQQLTFKLGNLTDFKAFFAVGLTDFR